MKGGARTTFGEAHELVSARLQRSAAGSLGVDDGELTAQAIAEIVHDVQHPAYPNVQRGLVEETDDQAGKRQLPTYRQLTKIIVLGDDDPIVALGEQSQSAVGDPRVCLESMEYIMSGYPERRDDRGRTTLVGQEPHAYSAAMILSCSRWSAA